MQAFGKLTGICTGYGGTYNPGQQNLQVNAMTTLLNSAQQAWEEVKEARKAYEEAVKAGVAQVIAAHGPVAGLVNNAGGQFPSPLSAIAKKGFDAVVANNLTGGFLMMREVFNQSMQKHGGSIVNMTADFRQ